MSKREVNRRDFHRWGMAALGGVWAGAMAGCGGPAEEPAAETTTPSEEAMASAEVHACRGLNACRGQGASGDNDCAGQGTCATIEHHHCGGLNACKGQGGCGENPAANECKGQGGCAIPMTHGDAWDRARERFENEMAAAGKTIGEPPPKQ